MCEQPSASDGTRATAQNPVLGRIPTLVGSPLSGVASPIPSTFRPNVGLVSPHLQQMEAVWYQRYTDQVDKFQAQRFLRFKEVESEWFQRYQSTAREASDQSVKIANLIVTILHEKAESMRLENKFNLRGALELIVYHARLIKKIDRNSVHGIQHGIDELARTPALVAALQDQASACQLALPDVTKRIGWIYDTVSKHDNGNEYVPTLWEDDYTREECAVLVAFLEVQRGWTGGFMWRKVKRMKQI
ncbi:unnamed protein product [Tuber aestivum]|uniref:Uncharacterized protein n=1 Tax=Tuber aestivum TaxID=59557 RepID=A0A292Q8L4_9PEZI|nr:unnamed protein product [Tuber aestivum]